MAAKDITLNSDFNKQIAHAAEMAAEIMGETQRQYALASALVGYIDAGTTAHGLAEVLEDRLSDIEQMSRLIQCLGTLQKEYCHE